MAINTIPSNDAPSNEERKTILVKMIETLNHDRGKCEAIGLKYKGDQTTGPISELERQNSVNTFEVRLPSHIKTGDKRVKRIRFSMKITGEIKSALGVDTREQSTFSIKDSTKIVDTLLQHIAASLCDSKHEAPVIRSKTVRQAIEVAVR